MDKEDSTIIAEACRQRRYVLCEYDDECERGGVKQRRGAAEYSLIKLLFPLVVADQEKEQTDVKLSHPVITDPDDPKFDLEAYLTTNATETEAK